MTKLWDIPGFTPELLDQMIKEKFVNVRYHPTLPLAILNYSDVCQYSKTWNAVTLNCRGTIIDREQNIVAKSFKKFFNYGEHTDEFDLDAPVQVTDKVDGSLGIIYPTGDGNYAVATRGSFESEQAIKATQLLNSKYPDYVPPEGYTVLVEIVFPENRIVLDYGDQEDLILIGGVCDFQSLYDVSVFDHLVGRFETCGPECFPEWPGPVTEVFNYSTLREALAAPPRKNAEGLVVRFTRTCEMVKVKQESYISLHKLVTGMNPRGIWELLISGKSVEDIYQDVPDEFYQYAKNIGDELIDGFNKIKQLCYDSFTLIESELGPDATRKDFAQAALKTDIPGFLFSIKDGKEINESIWKALKPHAVSWENNAS